MCRHTFAIGFRRNVLKSSYTVAFLYQNGMGSLVWNVVHVFRILIRTGDLKSHKIFKNDFFQRQNIIYFSHVNSVIK